jgi:hypothetical protein
MDFEHALDCGILVADKAESASSITNETAETDTTNPKRVAIYL